MTLREAAEGLGIYIGAAVNLTFFTEDSDYYKMMTEEISIMTPENSCKMPRIALNWTARNYSGCDADIDFAKKNGKKFRAHYLLSASGHPNPDWI